MGPLPQFFSAYKYDKTILEKQQEALNDFVDICFAVLGNKGD